MASIGQTELAPHLWVPHSQIQPIVDQKYLGKKETQKNHTYTETLPVLSMHKLLFLLYCLGNSENCSHSTYIALGITSNLEMI